MTAAGELRGNANIEGLLRDIYGRDMTHEVQAEVVGDVTVQVG